MATTSAKAAANAKAPEGDSRKPAFVLRARQTQTPEQIRRRDQVFYSQIGAAWAVSWKDKETGEEVNGYSVKLNQLPMNFDGDCVMVPYRERPEKKE